MLELVRAVACSITEVQQHSGIEGMQTIVQKRSVAYKFTPVTTCLRDSWYLLSNKPKVIRMTIQKQEAKGPYPPQSSYLFRKMNQRQCKNRSLFLN